MSGSLVDSGWIKYPSLRRGEPTGWAQPTEIAAEVALMAGANALLNEEEERFALTVNVHSPDRLDVSGRFPFQHEALVRTAKHVHLAFAQAPGQRLSVQIAKRQDPPRFRILNHRWDQALPIELERLNQGCWIWLRLGPKSSAHRRTTTPR